MAPLALAATVSGTLAQNTRWTLDQSPYLVSADLTLDNGATLTIDPGVEVRFALGAALIVKQGTLLANGTASAQIRFTSNRDGVGQKGDWGPIRFLAGNTAGNSILTQVVVAYGKGFDIQGASPTLNNLNFYGNQGAAITLDVAASPTGRGLTASNNDLNAIVVRPGVLTGQVTWGLVGIPYLVEQGWVTVGQRSLALEPDSASINPGVTLLLRAYLAQPAPAGGISLNVTSDNSAASTPATAMVAEGQTWVDIPVTGQSQGSATITISQAQLGSASVGLTVTSSKTLQVSPGQLTLATGASQSLAVRLAQPAPADGLTVKFATSDPAIAMVTPTLALAAGAQTGTVIVVGASEGNALLSASANGYTTATTAVTVASTALILPNSLTVAPGSSLTATLQLTTPAPAGGLTVRLTNPRSDLYSVPASVSVAAGATSASFVLQGLSTGTTLLTADASGYRTATAPVTVDTFTLNLDPPGDVSVPLYSTASRNVTLSKAAPKGGLTVSLTAANSTLADILPTEVFVPGGSTQGLQPVGFRGLAQGDTSVNLSAPGLQSRAVPVKVTTPLTLEFEDRYFGSQIMVAAGFVSGPYTSVGLTNAGNTASSSTDVVVNLACMDSTVCRVVPSTVSIPAGSTSATFAVVGLKPGKTTLRASAAGYNDAQGFPVTVVSPVLSLYSLDGSRVATGIRDNFALFVSTGIDDPHGPDKLNQLLASDTPLTFTIVNQSPAGIVDGVYGSDSGSDRITTRMVPAGTRASAISPNWLYVGTPSSAGSYQVNAVLGDVASVTSDTQSVEPVKLSFNSDVATLGSGMQGRFVIRTQEVITTPLTITLACEDAKVCSAPKTVTIPAGSGSIDFDVTGVGTGSTRLSATAPGAGSTMTTINVVNPQLVISYLDDFRPVGSNNDDFYVGIYTPNSSSFGVSERTVADRVVSLLVTEVSNSGVVSGLFGSAPIDGSTPKIVQVVIPAGSYQSQPIYVGQALSSGQYRLVANSEGLSQYDSDMQEVGPLQLKLFAGGTTASDTTPIAAGGVTTLNVSFAVNGWAIQLPAAASLKLGCVNQTICSVSGDVTIPAGAYGQEIAVNGYAQGSTVIHAETGFGNFDMPVVAELPVVVWVGLDPTVVQVINGPYFMFAFGFSLSDGNGWVALNTDVSVTHSSSIPGVSAFNDASPAVIPKGSGQSSRIMYCCGSSAAVKFSASAAGFNDLPVITVQFE